ncbi:hypothetical protein RBU60_06410 [Mesonia sp. MT50]|uniref:DNA-directed DNA polymerase family A palm domain-containing protein n=1 Tax=Mesonia profundi TaxID=3070998 RepID=A0ABU1A3F5_9FLAO|nr:hypothetical protein [Mesonia profundi]MDQ7917201.1 hypothetical protein [Mesonia profundi]
MNKENYDEENSVQIINTSKDEYPRMYFVYIPKNLDIDELVERYPPNINRFNKDKLAYVVSLIYSIPMRLKDYDFQLQDGYTPINSVILKTRVREYKEYLIYLVRVGVLEKRSLFKYQAGLTSSGYRFTLRYNKDIRKYIITWKRLIKAICKRKRTSKEVFVPITANTMDYLEKWWNDDLEFDYLGAKKWLFNLYLEERENEIPHCERKYYSRKIIIEKFKDRDYILHQDSTSGRVHTILTQLKGELRQFIKYKGEPLMAIDIKNSQPYLSLSILNPTKYKDNGIRDKIYKYNNEASSTIMLALCNYPNYDTDDIKVFTELVANGRFYEAFGDQLQKKQLIDEPCPSKRRKKAKQIMFSSMFGHNNEKCKVIDPETKKVRYFPNEGMILFKEQFPSVHHIFKIIKKNKHNALACILQNLEAEIVLHKACKIITDIRPEAPLFTLHDSIITTEENVHYVKEVLSKVLFEAIGVAPAIKIEHWNEKMEAA